MLRAQIVSSSGGGGNNTIILLLLLLLFDAALKGNKKIHPFYCQVYVHYTYICIV